MKDTGLKLYQAIYDTLTGAAISNVYSVVPANEAFPYVVINNIIANEATSAKDRFITYGTIDVSIYSASLTGQGSKSEMLGLTDDIKQSMKPTKTSKLTMSGFNMHVWYISNESQRQEKTKDKNIFINTIQYYYEIEEN